jgi:glyoxylase I family protein
MKEKRILKLHHVSLIIKDLDRALFFYQKVLGLELDTTRPDLGYPGAWLTLPGQQQLHLLQLENPDKDSIRPEHGGRDRHVAFMVSSINQISESLREFDIPFTQSKSGRKALFCRDPDGNTLEFIEN